MPTTRSFADSWLYTVLEDLRQSAKDLPLAVCFPALSPEQQAQWIRWMENAGTFLSLIPDQPVQPGALDAPDDRRKIWLCQLGVAIALRGIPLASAGPALEWHLNKAHERRTA